MLWLLKTDKMLRCQNGLERSVGAPKTVGHEIACHNAEVVVRSLKVTEEGRLGIRWGLADTARFYIDRRSFTPVGPREP